MTTLNLQVGASADDGFSLVGLVYDPSSSSLHVGEHVSFDANSWYRFTGVSGLSGATIDSAVVLLWGHAVDTGTAETAISAEDAAAPTAPVDLADHTSRVRTTATVAWDSPDLDTADWTTSPSIVSVIQELADSYDPSAIQILHDQRGPGDGTTNKCQPSSYDDLPAEAPRLDINFTAGGAPPPPPTPPPGTDLGNALAGRHGPVTLEFRYQQRDHDFVLEADISNAIFAASIELDNNRPIVRTARFTINADAMPAGFDPAQDHIAVIVETLVLGAFVEVPMGLFHLDVPREIHESEGRETWEVDASDMTTHLLQNRTESPYTVAAGANYITAIEAILDLLGLNHNLPAVALTTPVAFTWGPGVPFFDIVRDLAFAINRFTPWPDEQGVFTTIERVDPSGVTPNYSPSTTVEPRMIREPFEKSEDHTRWPNRIVSLIDNPLRTPEFSLRVNDDPTSPISTVSAGATITEELNGSRVVDTATNEEIVEYEIADRAARAEAALLRTNFDPRRRAHESYEITIETEEVATLWRVDGWRLELEPEATMEHRLGRARAIIQSIEIALGGTILTATEAQIVAGGLTILLTQNGETWESGATFNAERQNIIDGLVSAQSEGGGWNATVVPALGVGDVVRTSATVVTITLPAVGGYAITANETVTSSVPDAAIVNNPSSVTAPTFIITA